MANRPRSVVQWLESLSLDQFRNEFLFNGYTELKHLCTLTPDDLNCIGITQRGYQKRILQHLPTEAEATLSEFSGGRSASLDDIKPKIPPRRSKNTDKENGNSIRAPMPSPDVLMQPQQSPSFDDDSYLQVSPAELKVLAGDAPREQSVPFSSGSTRSSGGSSSGLVPEVPQRSNPKAPPRRSIDPLDESQKPKPVPRRGRKSPPPPLPERNNDKGDLPTRPIPKKRSTQLQSGPVGLDKSIEPKSILPDLDSNNVVDKRTISTNPFSNEDQEEYDEPEKLINVLPPTTTAYNPFNPFTVPDASQFPDLTKRLQDRPVPLPPPITTSPETTVTMSPEQPPEDLLRRPVPQPPTMMADGPSLPPPPPPMQMGMGHAQLRSLPDGSPASSPEVSNDEDDNFQFPPPPPPPRASVQNTNRSPPPLPPMNDIPPPVEDLDELPLRSPPVPLTVPPHLEFFDPIMTQSREPPPPPPPPPSQQDAEESLLQRLNSRPVPQPPTVPPRPPPQAPRTDHLVHQRRESDLIDMSTPQVGDFEAPFKFGNVQEDSIEEFGRLKLNQSFEDSQSLRSKDSPDSGLGFLQDNQSDHSHQSDQSSHHSDHLLANKRDSVDSMPPMLPPKSSLSSQSLNSRSSQSISSHGSQTPSLPPPLEKELSHETSVPYPSSYAKSNDSIDESEYDFLRDAETGPEPKRMSGEYFSLSEATSNRPPSEVEYLTLAEAETRPVSIFGKPAQPPPPLASSHRIVYKDPEQSRASYLKLCEATSGELYDAPVKALPPIPTEPYDKPPSPSSEEPPIRPARRAPPPPPGRNSDPSPTPMPRNLTSAPPAPKYAHVNKGFIADSNSPQSTRPPTPPSPYDNTEAEYDELRLVNPDIHGSFSSFKELAQSEDSDSEAELLDEEIDGAEGKDSVPVSYLFQ